MARLTEKQIRAELERVAQALSLSGEVTRQAIEEVSRVYVESAYCVDAALRQGSQSQHEVLQALRAEFLTRVAQITDTHADVLQGLVQRSSLPPAHATPERLSWFEQLDRALLGEPTSKSYQLADQLTLGLFRQKR